MRPRYLRFVLAAWATVGIWTAPVLAQTPSIVFTTVPLAAHYDTPTSTAGSAGIQLTPPVRVAEGLGSVSSDSESAATQKFHFTVTVPITVTNAIVPASSTREPASLGTYSVGCAVGPRNVRAYADLSGVFVFRNVWGHAEMQPATMPSPANGAGNETLTATLSFDANVPAKRLMLGLKTATYVCVVHNNVLHTPMFPDRSVTDSVQLP